MDVKNPHNISKEIPKHLNSVNKKHFEKLKGFHMFYKTIPNGSCLENSLAVHVYEDEREGEKVKRRINHHVADNWDNYYQYKIPLPYKETVGVGAKAYDVDKKTREEMLELKNPSWFIQTPRNCLQWQICST